MHADGQQHVGGRDQRPLLRSVKRALQRSVALLHLLTGEGAYGAYCAHRARTHPGSPFSVSAISGVNATRSKTEIRARAVADAAGRKSRRSANRTHQCQTL
ncbi:CstA-like transporter-associated (seleno)protein [Leucobacter coleopterorum]|uniref:CstA-like transporter-associated (seleno)protein n=1 Tax=Leucobacter coleopterorum TaxID=2714933 RepID=UPI00198123F8|nr:CstA-like transporter-associated (seleno)protein [Leucobacter coleopterorum]